MVLWNGNHRRFCIQVVMWCSELNIKDMNAPIRLYVRTGSVISTDVSLVWPNCWFRDVKCINKTTLRVTEAALIIWTQATLRHIQRDEGDQTRTDSSKSRWLDGSKAFSPFSTPLFSDLRLNTETELLKQFPKLSANLSCGLSCGSRKHTELSE